jgi:hypothetical protein
MSKPRVRHQRLTSKNEVQTETPGVDPKLEARKTPKPRAGKSGQRVCCLREPKIPTAYAADLDWKPNHTNKNENKILDCRSGKRVPGQHDCDTPGVTVEAWMKSWFDLVCIISVVWFELQDLAYKCAQLNSVLWRISCDRFLVNLPDFFPQGLNPFKIYRRFWIYSRIFNMNSTGNLKSAQLKKLFQMPQYSIIQNLRIFGTRGGFHFESTIFSRVWISDNIFKSGWGPLVSGSEPP